jgi:DNA mismatch endonuclease, patch repair protein
MYVRDKRSPVPKNEAVSRVMSANRPKNSKPELHLRKALWHTGLKGYRLHYKIKLPSCPRRGGTRNLRDGVVAAVRPDISFVSKKLAIFVHGCFWHRCPKCDYKLPKNNTEFWQAKFDRNVARDQQKVKDLEALGWKVTTVWECDLKNDLSVTISAIQEALI